MMISTLILWFVCTMLLVPTECIVGDSAIGLKVRISGVENSNGEDVVILASRSKSCKNSLKPTLIRRSSIRNSLVLLKNSLSTVLNSMVLNPADDTFVVFSSPNDNVFYWSLDLYRKQPRLDYDCGNFDFSSVNMNPIRMIVPTIARLVRRKEMKASALVAGYDKDNNPTLFTIQNLGVGENVNFSCIGGIRDHMPSLSHLRIQEISKELAFKKPDFPPDFKQLGHETINCILDKLRSTFLEDRGDNRIDIHFAVITKNCTFIWGETFHQRKDSNGNNTKTIIGSHIGNKIVDFNEDDGEALTSFQKDF